MTEEVLRGGDMNLVVRVGETVRRPAGRTDVRELLLWFERVGFDGAPRYLGIDEQGREILQFVEGEPAFPPVPSSDEVVAGIGLLLRRAHDAQAGRELMIHGDLFWTNVVFRDGLPAALIDWELANHGSAILEVAMAATYWAGLRIDAQLDEWGIPKDRRGKRLRILCDAYGLTADERARLLPELMEHRRARMAKGIRGATPPAVVAANARWVEEHAEELGTFLS